MSILSTINVNSKYNKIHIFLFSIQAIDDKETEVVVSKELVNWRVFWRDLVTFCQKNGFRSCPISGKVALVIVFPALLNGKRLDFRVVCHILYKSQTALWANLRFAQFVLHRRFHQE